MHQCFYSGEQRPWECFPSPVLKHKNALITPSRYTGLTHCASHNTVLSVLVSRYFYSCLCVHETVAQWFDSWGLCVLIVRALILACQISLKTFGVFTLVDEYLSISMTALSVAESDRYSISVYYTCIPPFFKYFIFLSNLLQQVWIGFATLLSPIQSVPDLWFLTNQRKPAAVQRKHFIHHFNKLFPSLLHNQMLKPAGWLQELTVRPSI